MTGEPMTDLAAAALHRAAGTIHRLRERVQQLEQQARVDEPIAVVGTACRFPGGATDPDRYWHLLRAGQDVVAPVPADRWAKLDWTRLDDPDFARLRVWAGTLDDVDGFDAGFFGIGPVEAEHLDPQQRLILETAWEATERAGWTLDEMGTHSTGVFVGVSHQDYMLNALLAQNAVSGYLGAGNARSIIANRVSYLLGLHGPSIAVDTACSSSLVAIHLAVQSLRTRESDLALAGGVNLILSPISTTVTGRALPFAPDGRTKTLDADADGMVRGEGCGVVALKRLSDAVADGDHIEAVILASVCNQGGRTNGLTAPNPLAQQDLLQRALAQAALQPEDITFVELHGTGTPLGDPIEYEAIAAAYGGAGRDAPVCWLSSVKPNIGHLESAAGVASFIKVVETVRRDEIVPQVNLRSLSPFVDLRDSRFAIAIADQPQAWQPQRRRVAGVSSFGFGGTNAHLIIAEAPSVPPDEPERTAQPVLLPVSARGRAALIDAIDSMATHLQGSPDESLRPVAATAARRRNHHTWRTAVVAEGTHAAAVALRRTRDRLAATVEDRRVVSGTPRIGFVYSGQTGQWPGMGADLYTGDEVVRAELDAWHDDIAAVSDYRLTDTLFGADASDALADTRFAQLAIVALQAALTARWSAWGVTPLAVCGHSVGEVSAALTAGVFSRPDAVRLVLARGTILHQHARGGQMMAVEAPADTVAACLADAGIPAVGIAAINGPAATVIAGPAAAMAAAAQHVSLWPNRVISDSYAFHGPDLLDTGDEFQRRLGALTPQATAVPMYSTVTGARATGEDLHARHWAANVARPVRFMAAMRAMLAEIDVDVVVEIGPHGSLVPHTTALLRSDGRNGIAVSSLRRGRRDRTEMLGALGQLWSAGAAVDWSAIYPGPAPHRRLPTYPWQRRRYWVADDTRSDATAADRLPEPRGEASAPSTAGMTLARRPDATAILHRLRQQLMELLDITDEQQIDVDRPARDYDIDSMAFVQLKNRLEDELGVAIPITALVDGASLTAIAERLATSASPPSPDQEATAMLQRLDGLTEAELDALLSGHDTREES